MENRKISKKVLLVYPEFPLTYWGFQRALKFINKKASIPPLGLLTVAAMLPQNWEIRFVDMNTEELTDAMIKWADLVFISAMLIQQKSFSNVVALCNKLHTPVVAGGPYPTSSYKEIENVNYFVLNEAEVTLPKFLSDFEKGEAKHIYSSADKPDITKTPLPRFDLLNMKKYGSMALQYSRGCPFNCEFCDIIEMFGRKMRTKSVKQMIKELNRLFLLGWRGAVFIVDDNFIGNKIAVKEFLPEIIVWQKKHRYPFSFYTEASVDLAEDKELMDLMVEAGFNMVFLGIETPVEETLRHAGKLQNIRGVSLLEKVKKIQEAGLEASAGFIAGFDTDPPNIGEILINFIQDAGIPTAMVGLMLALPGTQLYKRLELEERLLHASSGNNTHELELNFRPKMDAEKLISEYKQIIASIYDPQNYFSRCLRFLERLQPRKHYARKVKFEELLALFRSFTRQTFSYYGYHYLRYLIKSLRIKPQLFPEAIVLAIKGDHFFKITYETLAVDAFKEEVAKTEKSYSEKIQTTKTWITSKVEQAQTAYTCFKEEKMWKEVEDKIIELQKFKTRLLKELKKQYYQIDADFRHYVEGLLDNIEKALNDYLNQLRETVPSKSQQYIVH